MASVRDLSGQKFGRLTVIKRHGINKQGHVQWTDEVTQKNNKSNNVRITFNDDTHTLSEWSRILGINYKTLYTRIQNGWDLERAFSVSAK